MAAWCGVLADRRVACRGFFPGFGFPAAHEVLGGHVGVTGRFGFPLGKDPLGLAGGGQRSLHVYAAASGLLRGGVGVASGLA